MKKSKPKVKEKKKDEENFDFMKITNEVDLSACLIPNIVDIFFVNIKPHKYFDIRKEIFSSRSNSLFNYH